MVDLFAGAGGITLGFRQAGVKPVFAIESDPAAANTYATNFGCHILADPIEDVSDKMFPKVDLVVGGPPCQGFSPLGRDRDAKSRAAINTLWKQYLRAVKSIQPKLFVIENVPQFLKSAQFAAFLRYCRNDDVLTSYDICYSVLNAADYGVPQRRRRAFVIASRVGQLPWPPPVTHGPDSQLGRPYTTVREAIGDLPLKPTGRDLHVGRNPTAKSVARYQAVPEGGNRFDLARNAPALLPPCWRNKKSGTTDVFGRLWWDRPALTIRTEFFKPEKGRYLHPKANRPITHREAARLQTFPDSFVFEGTNLEIARQIGNAVPPILAQAVGAHLKTLLTRPATPY